MSQIVDKGPDPEVSTYEGLIAIYTVHKGKESWVQVQLADKPTRNVQQQHSSDIIRKYWISQLPYMEIFGQTT